MKNNPNIRYKLASLALERLPPLIQKTLLDQRDFLEEYGFKADVTISLGDTDISFQRSDLFKAIRRVFAGQPEVIVTDTDDCNWKVFSDDGKGEQPQIIISNNEQRHVLPDFTVFSTDKTVRLRSFEKSVEDVNLPANVATTWRNILSERRLSDEEIDQFHIEFRDTPVHIARAIRAEIPEGRSNKSSLAPPSRRYFARLVGEYDESPSVRDYATGTGKKFMEELSAWRPYDGFLSSLFLSSHSTLTNEIKVEHLKKEEITQAFEFLVERGDKLSQLGAVEVGLRILPDIPEIEALLIRLVKRIRDDDTDKSESDFKLFSALFIFVDSELSRTRIFSNAPPFFRRLASLAQAALIQREVIAAPINIASFCEQILKIGGEQFHLQSLADMRLEPRWNPIFADASQIRADFFGRLMFAGENYEKNISSVELRGLLLGSEPKSIPSLIDSPQPYFPGPLEGEEKSANAPPDELKKIITSQLQIEEVSPSSFTTLINSAFLFRVDPSQAEIAAEALKTSNHRFVNIKSRFQLLVALQGLATVAAVSRKSTLADELRIITQRYRRDAQYSLSVEEALIICLIASASRHDLRDWKENVGDWLTEIAFEDFQDNEGEILYSHLRCLCHAVPELWSSCGKVDAALLATLEKQTS